MTEEELREKIRNSDKYKIAKYWLDVMENTFDKIEDKYKKVKTLIKKKDK